MRKTEMTNSGYFQQQRHNSKPSHLKSYKTIWFCSLHSQTITSHCVASDLDQNFSSSQGHMTRLRRRVVWDINMQGYIAQTTEQHYRWEQVQFYATLCLRFAL